MPLKALSWSMSNPNGIAAHAQPEGGHVGVVGIGSETGEWIGTEIGGEDVEAEVVRARRETEGRRWPIMAIMDR